jgi:hypothetical protein
MAISHLLILIILCVNRYTKIDIFLNMYSFIIIMLSDERDHLAYLNAEHQRQQENYWTHSVARLQADIAVSCAQINGASLSECESIYRGAYNEEMERLGWQKTYVSQCHSPEGVKFLSSIASSRARDKVRWERFKGRTLSILEERGMIDETRKKIAPPFMAWLLFCVLNIRFCGFL